MDKAAVILSVPIIGGYLMRFSDLGIDWDNIRGSLYERKIVFGYNYAIPGPCVAFGTSSYTIQIAIKYDGNGGLRTRAWYSDAQRWSGWT